MTATATSVMMGALADPQYERFCLERAAFKSPFDAYKLAGFVPHRGNCHRLNRRKDIRTRIAELVQENRRALGLRPEAILARLDRVGDANIQDFFEPVLDDAGKRTGAFKLKDITALPRELTACLAGIEFVAGEPKLKLHDSTQVNLALLKHFGMMPDPASAPNQTNIFNILNVDDQRALAEALEDSLPRGQARLDHAPQGERGAG